MLSNKKIINKKIINKKNIKSDSESSDDETKKTVKKIINKKNIKFDSESSDDETKKTVKKIINKKSDSDSSSNETKKTVKKIINKKSDLESSEDKIKKNDKNNNKIWEHIFKYINYACDNDKIISADDIKNASKSWIGIKNQFEPRLLCKQDSSDERPYIFSKNNICILSIKNGEYLLTKNNIYINLKYPKKKHTEIKKNLSSLLLKLGNSESSLIDNLRYSGIFEGENYLNEKIKYGSLLNGRHRCSFETYFGNSKIKIQGSQFETDACYESDNKILLIECKNIKTEIKNFNIRQLYYPYRYIYDLIGKEKNKKKIIILYINKDKDDFIHIWKYEFTEPSKMMSIKNLHYNKYKFL
jgi:hypothetical protein